MLNFAFLLSKLTATESSATCNLQSELYILVKIQETSLRKIDLRHLTLPNDHLM